MAKKSATPQLSEISVQYVLEKLFSNAGTILLVVAAFLLGMLWTQVRMLTNGGPTLGGVQPGGPTIQQPPQEQVTELTEAQWESILVDGYAGMIGDANAPVTMVEFTDYQCPFCARHYTETYKTLVSQYVETGQMKIIFRDLPLSFHPNAKDSAIAVRCAGEQRAFEGMHDLMFEKQTEWSGLTVDAAKTKFAEYAGELNLNQSRFTTCQASSNVAAAVDADFALASTVGATGTPTFFINGKTLVGAQPLSIFTAEIDALLD